MLVKNIKLENFRNYETLNLDFSEGINLIYGNNGQGKTNIVEALYMFATLKSHRVLKDKDLIKYNMPFAKSEMIFCDYEREYNAKFVLYPEKKRDIFVNDIKANKNSDLIGKFNAVLFSPEDFSIIKNGPSERRRFTDIAISQVKPSYFLRLVEYNKILKMKNKILKENPDIYEGMIDIYNEKLAENAAHIIYFRKKFYDYAKENCQVLHNNIALNTDKFEIIYEPSVKPADINKMTESLYENLCKFKQKEFYERVSVFGPHREDVTFKINGNKVREFASQGQQRTVILIMKLIQADYIKNITGEYPVLLLDDVLSELDKDRRKYILNGIKDKQVIITATDKGSFSRRKDTKLIHIEGGKVIDD